MRTVGIVGGLGPESTIDYYRLIVAGCRARKPDAGYPHIIINSLEVDRGIAMLEAHRVDDLACYLVNAVGSLARAGATFGCIAANTPHLVFDEVEARSPIPLISIVRAAAEYSRVRGFRRLVLFGTGFSMSADFYPKEFQVHRRPPCREKDERRRAHRRPSVCGHGTAHTSARLPDPELEFIDTTAVHVEATVEELLR